MQLSLAGARQDSRLVRLPAELVLQIAGWLRPSAADAVALSLTCKRLLNILLRRLRTPDPGAHRAPWSADPCWRYTDLPSLEPACGCGQLETLLRRRLRPRDARGRVDRTRRLCVDCLTYLPRRRGHWAAAARRLRRRNALWDDELQGDWDLAAGYFGRGVRMQCPLCRLREHGGVIDRDKVHGLTPAELASLGPGG